MAILFPSTYLVVEQKEPLWKQLPRGPPSGGRDTAGQDFQRGAAENSIRQEWFISVSHLSEISWFRYDFNLSGPPPQLCQSIDDPGVGLAYFSTLRTYRWTSPPYLLCVGVCTPSVEKAAQKACNMRMHYSIYDKTMCFSEWVSADRCWYGDIGVQAYCGRKSHTLKPLANQP